MLSSTRIQPRELDLVLGIRERTLCDTVFRIGTLGVLDPPTVVPVRAIVQVQVNFIIWVYLNYVRHLCVQLYV